VNFQCERCGRTYVADDKVRGRAFKMRCKACGEIIVVKPAGGDHPSEALPSLTQMLAIPGARTEPPPPPPAGEEPRSRLPELLQAAAVPIPTPPPPPAPSSRFVPFDFTPAPAPVPAARSVPDEELAPAPATGAPSATDEAEEAFASLSAEMAGEAARAPVEPAQVPVASAAEAPAATSQPIALLTLRNGVPDARPAPVAPAPSPVFTMPPPATDERKLGPAMAKFVTAPERKKRFPVVAGVLVLGLVCAGSYALMGTERSAPTSTPVPHVAVAAPAPAARAEVKPADPVAPPVAEPSPAEAPEPVVEARPAEPAKPVAEAKPAEPAKPAPEAKATAAKTEAKPAAPRTEGKPAEPAKAVAATKPAPARATPVAAGADARDDKGASPKEGNLPRKPEPAVAQKPAEPAKVALAPARTEKPAAAAEKPAPVEKEKPAAAKAEPSAGSAIGAPPDASSVEALVAANAKAFRTCVSDAQKTEPDIELAGRQVDIFLTVKPTGQAVYPTIGDVQLRDTRLGQCLKNTASRMSFPAFEGAQARVRVSLVLSP
jgi:hypothetical protein